MARLSRLCAMADCSVSLTACRGDGELVSCRGCFQLVKERPDSEHFALCWLQEQSEEEEPSKLLEALRCSETRWPTPVMFPAPLSNKCCLTNMMSSALRREPQQVPRGCVALSRLALPERDGSYFFSVRVDRVLPSWTSRLPFLGVTCVSPEEVHRSRCFFGSLPHAFCLAESAVAGGTGEAWLHAESWPLVPKLGQQLEAEATRRHLSSLPEHRRAAPFVPRCGDLLGCRYRNLREAEKGPELASAIGLYVNGDLAFEFDFPRRLPSKPLYAVVDVCHCVYQVTMQPSAEDLLMGS
ncbi:unnamed protein product [Effrenium voratum]|uniref:Uncharacterized protein n=1 Tax=Effrenium voratum TaxID=2562239 RepID=A0AA36I6X2_9DINO|nr:unnamed protein product [Effrenium voratum]